MPTTRSWSTSPQSVCLLPMHTGDMLGLYLRIWRRSGLLVSWILYIQVVTLMFYAQVKIRHMSILYQHPNRVLHYQFQFEHIVKIFLHVSKKIVCSKHKYVSNESC